MELEAFTRMALDHEVSQTAHYMHEWQRRLLLQFDRIGFPNNANHQHVHIKSRPLQMEFESFIIAILSVDWKSLRYEAVLNAWRERLHMESKSIHLTRDTWRRLVYAATNLVPNFYKETRAVPPKRDKAPYRPPRRESEKSNDGMPRATAASGAEKTYLKTNKAPNEAFPNGSAAPIYMFTPPGARSALQPSSRLNPQ